MGKRKPKRDPRPEAPGSPEDGSSSAAPAPADASETSHVARRRIQLEIELLAQDPPGYRGEHIDGRLTPLQASVLNRYWHTAHGTRMRSGGYVETRIDAIRLLLERIAEHENDM